jgi:hypothetical protein
MIFKHDIVINMMKKLLIVSIPLMLVMSVIVVASNANVNLFAQQANQTAPQAKQTTTKNNQTTKSQSPKPTFDEKLLNFTNQAILAFKDKNRTGEVNSLKQIQDALINASGKQVVIVPSDAVTKSK